MLVRVDPKTQGRVDAVVPARLDRRTSPATRRRRSPNSFILGGPKLTIDTIRSVTGITPNYYVSVDFDAFTQTVNAFDGAYVDVDRRYYNLNTNSSATNFNSIDIQPGYQLMRGQEALQYVRHRHDDDDTYRLARQQLFLREFKVEARPDQHRPQPDDAARHGEEEPQDHRPEADVDRRHGAVREHAPVDPEEQHGQRAVRRPRASDRSPDRIAVDQSEIDDDGRPVPRSRSDAGQPRRRRGRRQGQEGRAPTYDPATIQVEVRNGNGKVGAAADLEAQLVKRGWKNARAHGDAEKQHVLRLGHLLRHEDGLEGGRDGAEGDRQPERHQAARRGRDRRAERAVADPDRPAVAGVRRRRASWSVRRSTRCAAGEAEAAAGRREGRASPSDRSRDVARWKKAQKGMGHAIMYPDAAAERHGHGRPADQVVRRVPPLQAARQERAARDLLRVVDAGPDDVRRAGPRLGHAADPAVAERDAYAERHHSTCSTSTARSSIASPGTGTGGTYWLSNSIVDGLSNSTMWAIATGFRRVP